MWSKCRQRQIVPFKLLIPKITLLILIFIEHPCQKYKWRVKSDRGPPLVESRLNAAEILLPPLAQPPPLSPTVKKIRQISSL